MSDQVGVDAEVDLAGLRELVASGTRAVTRAVAMMASQLGGQDIPDEAPRGATGALSEPWQPSERDPLTWVVVPPDDAWYAHIVAFGSRAHGPTRARAMTVGDQFVTMVSGVTPNRFDQRAIAGAEQVADQLLAAALAEEGL